MDNSLIKKSVTDLPTKAEGQSPSATSWIFQVAEAAQSVTPWGQNPRARDRQLRSFWHSESWLSSVVYSVSIRNSSFTWEVTGKDPEKPRPRNTINAVTRILQQSNMGAGWEKLILKTCVDLYTQDNGAFWEVIRRSNSQNSPVVNISHLDAAKCTRTGDPKFPVLYTNRFGNEIAMPHWKVRTLEELPSPIEEAYGLQYCATTRALMAAEIIQSIATYKLEKVSGNFTKAIDAIGGLTKGSIDDALAMAEEQNLNKGLLRYSMPVLIPGLDPTTALSHIHIELASLPDNFDEDTSFKWYVAQLAAAFGVDYQEIAPLMTGSLGSSQQSEIMHLKTRGKGPALIMNMFEYLINGLIPNNVLFRFLEQDIRSESEKAEAKFTRVKSRNLQVSSGELTIAGSREMAVLEGDIPRWLAEEMPDAPELNTEKPEDEFGTTQVEEGNTPTVEKMNMKHVRFMQDKMKDNLCDLLEESKQTV